MRIYIWVLMPTACVDTTMGNGVKGEFNRVGENSVQLSTNPRLFDYFDYAGQFHFTGDLMSL